MSHFDAIVVGAGFSGAVVAERLASQANKKVLVLEQRSHIGGNCYDYKDENGILIHKYGPHLFHTDKPAVWEYLSQFTQWHPYEHKVLSSVDNELIPIPFNLNSLELVYSPEKAERLSRLLIAQYGEGAKVPILTLMETSDPELNELAQFIYDKFFVNYTTKQWGVKPEDISPEVTARVPVVLSRDDRYFQDKWQAIPKEGYTRMFERILDHENITYELNCDALKRLHLDIQHQQIFFEDEFFSGPVVFTGMLDELFDFAEGELPYRSLKFAYENLPRKYFQPVTTVNYPNEHAFTRITEFKHILPVESDSTTIVKEYPAQFDRNDLHANVPYYPVLSEQNHARYAKYKQLSERFSTLHIVGRLADYRYYNMDDAVLNALVTFDKLFK